jgi:hypothetical protein
MKNIFKWSVVCLSLLFLGFFANQSTFSKDVPSLKNDDCAKCHFKIPGEVEAKGMAHKTKVGCTDCHDGHPPSNREIIPKCSNCHEGQPHFALKDCLKCHTNPHTPLEIKLPPNITDACLTCHSNQIEQLKAHPSAHTTLTCSGCHNEHGLKPECLKCHEPHADFMVMNDCRMCHQAHMPLEVAYGPEVPSKSCGACHPDTVTMLEASQAKHGSFLCSKCHQAKHKMVPKCEDCHGKPHPQGILAKFAKCSDCHNIAHDLIPMVEEKQEAKK